MVCTSNFNPRPPRGGRHGLSAPCNCLREISIHALREESDAALLLLTTAAHYFNPRPPRGERQKILHLEIFWGFISIHALREESDELSTFLLSYQFLISIHALREESDRTGRWRSAAPSYFNPRPPRGERHPRTWDYLSRFSISIHALREESDFVVVVDQVSFFGISIHALREESDLQDFSQIYWLCEFQSTPSARRATGGP